MTSTQYANVDYIPDQERVLNILQHCDLTQADRCRHAS